VDRCVTAEAAPHAATDEQKIRALPWCLAQSVLNTFFVLWTFGGSVFVLFLDELGLSKGLIGLLLSLFPFCGLLALGFAPVAARLGRKRVFLAGYGLRKPVMALLLLLPWIAARHGHPAAVVFLSVVIAAVAVLRALAETAYYAWFQEFVPNRVRGRFSAWSAVLGFIASGVALAIAGHVIGSGAGLGRYMLLIGLGSAIGVVGVAVMVMIPGGAPARDPGSEAAHLPKVRAALCDRSFVAFLGGTAGLTTGIAMLGSFLPLYAREQVGLLPATVVRLDLVAAVGGAASSLAWGWLSDRVGSRPVLMPSAALMAVLPLGWLLLPREVPHPALWCAALYLAFGVASNGTTIGAGRLLFNGVIPPVESTAYTSVYYAWQGIAGGVAPLLAGGILTAGAGWRGRLGWVPLDGYALLFASALGFLALAWYLYGRVRPDDRHTTRTVLRGVMGRISAGRRPIGG
jgi:MFS family permease